MMAEPTTAPNNNEDTIHRLSVQLKKLTDANNKYKNLLKLAKDRIQAHEEELASFRESNSQLQTRLEEQEAVNARKSSVGEGSKRKDALPADAVTTISNVCQRVKVGDDAEPAEIWALMEFKVVSEEYPQYNKEYKEWVCFNSESQLQDYVRRDTGEPLTIPPFSLTPSQSAQIEMDANQRVSKLTEEFRRFRVKSELARKQADAQIKELQNAKNHQHIIGGVSANDTTTPGSATTDARQLSAVSQQQLERLRAEMAAQEAYWKESYETLLAENTALKETGSEALLASQWRQRYETCKNEKEQLEQALKSANASASSNGEAEKYEQKYRDLKESFRLYRKKAKEIFEAQQQQHGDGGGLSSAEAITITGPHSSADAKLSYLKNLMLNYLTADPTVRDHMETAIGTVLQFTNEETKLVQSKKTASSDSWFG